MVYENAPATNAKMKEICEEAAKDSSLMEIVRCYRRMASEKRSDISRCKAVLVIRRRNIIDKWDTGQRQKVDHTCINEKSSSEAITSSTSWNWEENMESKSNNILASDQSTNRKKMLKTCSTYLHNQKQHPREPMIPSDVPHYPFQMVGSDLFHWNDQDFVLVVDYYSRYWEIEKLHKTDAATVIKKIKNVFSRMGIPEVMRSDNGPQYAAKTFEKFAKDWGFQHISSSPEYPRSNGLAEKTVQTVKDLLEKAKEDNKDPYLAMLEERNTPVNNYKSPAELAFGRQHRSIWQRWIQTKKKWS